MVEYKYKRSRKEMIITETTKLDYSLKTAEERAAFAQNLLPNLTKEQLNNKKYIEIITDYIVSAMTPEEKKQKMILTDNRMITINKRETSFQSLVDKFENGEDGLWNFMIENDKNILLTHKKEITEKDLKTINSLKDLKESIKIIEEKEKKATGKNKYKYKKWLIEMHQEQYIIKDAIKGVSAFSKATAKSLTKTDLKEEIHIDENGEPVSDCLVSFFNPEHLCALLCNYSALKEECWGKFNWDFWYLMEDLDALVEKTLRDKYPLYYKLLIYKIDGLSNADIQELLNDEFGISYSVEYISSLWRNKIPKMLAEQAKEDYLIWYYTYVEYGKWKRCSKCGEVKLAHNRFFSKNNTSKDGWYSICKCCRNKKKEVE